MGRKWAGSMVNSRTGGRHSRRRESGGLRTKGSRATTRLEWNRILVGGIPAAAPRSRCVGHPPLLTENVHISAMSLQWQWQSAVSCVGDAPRRSTAVEQSTVNCRSKNPICAHTSFLFFLPTRWRYLSKLFVSGYSKPFYSSRENLYYICLGS